MKTTTIETAPAYAGVDISKDQLDVAVAGQGPGHYANTAKGIAELLRVLAQLPGPVQVICEPSGGYERDLLEALWAEKIAVSLVNAARVRAFARARGLLAKSDAIDALVLRDYGELLRPALLAAPAPHRQRLAELVQRREQLVTLLATEEQRLTQTREAVVRKLGSQLIKALQKQLAQLDALIAAQIDEDDIVCVHNHPSGDPSPSAADVAITRQLHEAANIMEIELLDHVVIGNQEDDPTGRGYFSFREAGRL